MLSANERERYARHLTLPEIGQPGQKQLRQSRVLVIGAGGLGSPALLYLAAAGVGTIGIADDDVVDSSNLQRQVLFTEQDVGRSKARQARERLLALNSGISVQLHEKRFTRENALEIIGDYDLVLDGSDNFSTRYLANDACVCAGIPLISGSIHRFEGQISAFATSDGPCYRCLFPDLPDAALVPSCAEAGVLGVLPGVIGSLMATEAIKLICNIGELLIGRLLRYDALSMRISEIRFNKDPDCSTCGSNRQTGLRENYEFRCRTDTLEIEGVPANALLIDVRERSEYRARPSPGELIPMSELERRTHELPTDRTIVLLCASGARSLRAATMLTEQGFTRVHSLRGGLSKHPTFSQ